MLNSFNRIAGNFRSYFALGPNTIRGVEDIVQPTFDVQWLLTNDQDQEVFSAVTAAVAPGAVPVQVQVQPPRIGTWLLDLLTVSSNGPATSGSCILQGNILYTRSAIQAVEPIFDGERSFARIAGATFLAGKAFVPPRLLTRTADFSDVVQVVLFNAAASVGNATAAVSGLWRAMQSNR